MIQLLTSFFFNMYVEESFILDCHALQARNDAITLPLEDFATFLKGPSSQHIPTNSSPISPHSNIPLQIKPLPSIFSIFTRPTSNYFKHLDFKPFS
ncbi:MAG: hypothetical protein K9G11_01350 [Rickettsiaceae bacterium]|nr:hypothetical protein [Rickettsiaceae bacterium]